MISHTRERLKEWGNWGRGGFPTIPQMFRSIFGQRGANHGADMSPDVAEIDGIVCRAERHHRAILIKVYCNRDKPAEIARAVGCHRSTIKRRLEAAEYYVNAELDRPQRDMVDLGQHGLRADA